jgi:hypothetical protein
LGYWECRAPLTKEELLADREYLDLFQNALPSEITVGNATVWIHGREYQWTRLDVTDFGRTSR